MYACIFLYLFTWFSAFADPLVIGIAGGSGAGKTTLAQAMQKQLADSAVIIYMDNYFYDLSHLPPEERKKIILMILRVLTFLFVNNISLNSKKDIR